MESYKHERTLEGGIQFNNKYHAIIGYTYHIPRLEVNSLSKIWNARKYVKNNE